MRVFSKYERDTLIIGLEGELDHNASLYAKGELDLIFRNIKANRVVVDVSKLNFMDSTGIGVLLGKYKMLKTINVPIFIAGANGTIDKIFSLSGIYNIMPKIS